MSLELKISFAGDEQLTRRFKGTIDAMADFRPAWHEINKKLEAFQASVFRGKGAYKGLPKWQELSENYKKRKPASVRNLILVLTGALRRGFTQSTSEEAVRIFDKRFYVFGIDKFAVPYGEYHQTGTRRMPIRKPLRLTGINIPGQKKGIRTDIDRIILKHIRLTERAV